MSNLLDKKDIKTFVFAGKAIFTMVNTKTRNRFTYKVTKAKQNDIFFVSVLTGSDNISDYTFIGYIKTGVFNWSKKSRISRDSISFKAFNWLINNIINIPDVVEIWHEGKCCRCGRILTTPESIERGIGPECSRLLK